MREGTDIGYEHTMAYPRECQKECPKGVSIKYTRRGKNTYLSLQIAIGAKRIEKTVNEPCTMQGVTNAASKAVGVAVALKAIKSETEFLAWYDTAILHKNVIKNDLVTFGEAIAKVEQIYWDGVDKKRNRRDRANVSQQATWKMVYGRFYALLLRNENLITSLSTHLSELHGNSILANIHQK